MWTQERIDRITFLWGQGHSATEIACDLNCGFTRNAVIGKLGRLGMLNNQSRTVRRPTQRRRPKDRDWNERAQRRSKWNYPKSKPRCHKLTALIFAGIELKPAEPSDNVPFLDLKPRHCREVTGTGADGLATFCGHQKVDGYSFCAHHVRINFTARVKAKVLEAA